MMSPLLLLVIILLVLLLAGGGYGYRVGWPVGYYQPAGIVGIIVTIILFIILLRLIGLL